MIRLVPLTGTPGAAVALPRLPASIGSGEDADVFVAGASPRHAVLFSRDGDVVIVDSGSAAGTLLRGQRIDEAVLRAGDVIQLGVDGPELRFDREEGVAVAAVAVPVSQTMMLRVVGQSRRSLLRALAAVVVVAAALQGLSLLQNRSLHREMAGLRDEVRRADAERAKLERRVAEERSRAEGHSANFERRLGEDRTREEDLRARIASANGEEVKALKDELGATAVRIATLESERAAGERIISTYGRGVCLIQGAYGFADAAGRVLRHAEAEQSEDEDPGMPTADGKGNPYTVEYYGTGFLVEAGGLVLTNRHVAEPWWNDAAAQAFEARGFQPRFVRLRAYFPNHGDAFAMTPERISESADLALLRVPLAGRRIPILPLETERARAVPGQPVIVVGYPTGLEAILAKAETGVVKAILESQGTDSDRVTDALSAKGLIRPSTTQGHIGDITATDIVFDAPSAQGGSGGPVFNKYGHVIAVEYAVAPKFGGTSFGVPISFARELLRASGRPRTRRP